MSKEVIHLSYFFKEEYNDPLEIFRDERLNHLKKSFYQFFKNLYYSKSFFLDTYIYRHLYYALNLVEINKDKKVLDLGCAYGPFLPTLNEYGKRVIGLDYSYPALLNSKDLIKYKKHLLKNISIVNGDGQRLPFKDNEMDIVFCLEVFEHVPDPEKLINEIYRTLKPNGELVYSIPIEIGLSLILRQIIGKITNFKRELYSIRELLRNGVLKKPPLRTSPVHKDFDWRIIQKLVNKKFKQININYSPFPILRSVFNPTIILKVIKQQ